MKKRLLLVILAVVLVVSLGTWAACGEEEVVTEEEEWQWPERILCLAGSALSVASTTGWTAALAQDTGMTVRVVAESTIANKFKWHKEGRFFTNSEGSIVVKNVLEGNLGYATRDGGPYQIRILFGASQSDAGYLVRGDSDIQTIYDIKPGTRLVELAWVSGVWDFMVALLAWAGVAEEDIVRVPTSSHDAAMRAIQTGTADVTFEFPSHPAVVEAAAAPNGIRWLELPYDEDMAGAKRWLEVMPTGSFGINTQSPEIAGMKGYVGKNPVLVREDADPELVYQVAKWLDENYDLFKDNHAWNAYMTVPMTMDILGSWFLPAHEGLIRFLQEKGLWTEAHDVRTAKTTDLITRYCDAYDEAIALADDLGIKVDPSNEDWVELWENYKKQLRLPGVKMFVSIEE